MWVGMQGGQRWLAADRDQQQQEELRRGWRRWLGLPLADRQAVYGSFI